MVSKYFNIKAIFKLSPICDVNVELCALYVIFFVVYQL
jgi:hypothetical protein